MGTFSADLNDIIIEEDHTLLECYRLLDQTGYRMLICVDGGKFHGVVTDSDIRRGILSGIGLEDRIGPVLNRNPVVAQSDMSKESMLALMREKAPADPLPVVDLNGKLVNVFSMNDLLKAVALPNSAVIMAGGLGKRLMPLTRKTPKPLLKIGGKPIIERVINHLSDSGVEMFYVTVNYKSEMIKDYLKDGNWLGVQIEYLEEKKQLGTIGALSLLRDRKIDSPFIVMNGDILTRINFRRLLHSHEDVGDVMTVCLTNYQYNVPYGVIEVEDGSIVGMNEKPIIGFFINAGIYCVNPEIINLIPENEYYDITMLMDSLLSKKIRIGYFVIDEYWRDVGNPEDYINANQDFRNGDII